LRTIALTLGVFDLLKVVFGLPAGYIY